MRSEATIERVRRIADLRHDSTAAMDDLEAALVDLRAIRAFCDAAEADIARRIATGSSFPEAALAVAGEPAAPSSSPSSTSPPDHPPHLTPPPPTETIDPPIHPT